MSQILTKLRDADHILMARSDRDKDVNIPSPCDVQPGGILGEAKRDKLNLASVFSNAEVHKKSEQGFPEPLPYVWSM